MEERRGSLEVSLLRLVEDYNQNTHFIRENAEKSKKAAISATQRVSEHLLDTVNGGVQVSFTNEKLIEAEIRALAVTVARYSKQTNQWLAASRSMNSILKAEAAKISGLREAYRAIGQDLLRLLFFVEINAIGSNLTLTPCLATKCILWRYIFKIAFSLRKVVIIYSDTALCLHFLFGLFRHSSALQFRS